MQDRPERAGDCLWGGVVVSPLIGVIVGLIYRPAYKLSTEKRVWFSLVTLYVAITLFGLAIAVFDLAFGDPARGDMEGVLQTILGSMLDLDRA